MSQLFQHITFSRLEISPRNLSSWLGDRSGCNAECGVKRSRCGEVKRSSTLELFMSAEKVEREIDRQTGAQSPLVRKPYWSDVVHTRISQKAKSWSYQSIYVHMQWPRGGDSLIYVFREESLLFRLPPVSNVKYLSLPKGSYQLLS